MLNVDFLNDSTLSCFKSNIVQEGNHMNLWFAPALLRELDENELTNQKALPLSHEHMTHENWKSRPHTESINSTYSHSELYSHRDGTETLLTAPRFSSRIYGNKQAMSCLFQSAISSDYGATAGCCSDELNLPLLNVLAPCQKAGCSPRSDKSSCTRRFHDTPWFTEALSSKASTSDTHLQFMEVEKEANDRDFTDLLVQRLHSLGELHSWWFLQPFLCLVINNRVTKLLVSTFTLNDIWYFLCWLIYRSRLTHMRRASF